MWKRADRDGQTKRASTDANAVINQSFFLYMTVSDL